MMTHNKPMSLPYPTTIYMDEETGNKLRSISFELKLDQHSLINYWVNKNKDKKLMDFDINRGNYHHAVLILKNQYVDLERMSIHELKIPVSHLVYCYIRNDILQTDEILGDSEKENKLKQDIYDFEDNTDLSKWPTLIFRKNRLAKISEKIKF